jgi:hypothetical protein
VNEFNERDKNGDTEEFLLVHAKALESYAAFLKKQKKTGEAETAENSAKEKRAQAGTYQYPPWKP